MNNDEIRVVIANYGQLLSMANINGAPQPAKATMAVYVERLKDLVDQLSPRAQPQMPSLRATRADLKALDEAIREIGELA